MAHLAHQPTFTASGYLAWEPTQVDRHEYLDGEVFAMAGAEDRHVTVTMNAAFTVRQHLSGSPCRTYATGMRVHVPASNGYFYPDVLVTCSALDRASAMVKTEPKLIIEVLSPSTAAYDRGLKFSHYRSLVKRQCRGQFFWNAIIFIATYAYRTRAGGIFHLPIHKIAAKTAFSACLSCPPSRPCVSSSSSCRHPSFFSSCPAFAQIP